MKNPLNDINLYKVEQVDNDNDTPKMIVISYSRSGTVYAFKGYSTDVIGKAGGGGYDKIATALCEAIETLYDIDLDANGAAGFAHVRERAHANGITVQELSELIYI